MGEWWKLHQKWHHFHPGTEWVGGQAESDWWRRCRMSTAMAMKASMEERGNRGKISLSNWRVQTPRLPK